MNKKGHHELGIEPYAVIGGIIGFLIFYGKKFLGKIKSS